MTISPTLIRYCQYIKNTGQVPLKIAAFDEDWEPIGASVRQQLLDAKLVSQVDDAIQLTEKGHAAIL